jgi:hypothetical protein
MEQMCLLSFIENGHRTILYVYDDVKSVPDGVEIRDAREIMPTDKIIYHANTGSPAFHSDVFRLRMLEQTDFLWVDTDAYCLKPFVKQKHGFFFGWITDKRRITNTGVLGLPKTSKILHSMLELTKDEYPIPPWATAKRQDELRQLKSSGNGVHMSLMPWGVCGPEALYFFGQESGEIEYAFDGPVLYPVPFSATRTLHRTHLKKLVYAEITDETISVHLWGRRFRNIFAQSGGMPPEGSYADDLCKKHKLDPSLTAHLFVKKELKK